MPPSHESLNSNLTLGLLHQVNNVLTGIYFNIEECQAQVDPEDPLGATLEEIAESVTTLHRLLDRTVDVNLPLSVEDDANYHDFEELVSRQLDLVRIVFPKTVSFAMRPSTEPLHVHASEQKFRRALLQLAAALREALPASNARVELELRACEAASGEPAAAAIFHCEPSGWDSSVTLSVARDEAAAFGWRILSEPAALLLPRVDLET
jgi:signal transduction histidine kinase